MSKIVGVIGLGLMGLAMSKKLIEAKFEVQGFDIDQKRVDELIAEGGKSVTSAKEAAIGADFLITSLLYSEVVREVCLGKDGICESGNKGLIVIDTSTSRPEDSIQTGSDMKKEGYQFLDASLSGGSPDVLKRNMVAMVGGDEEAFSKATEVLDVFSRSIYHLGSNGAGARTKLIVNQVLGLNRLVLAEGLVMGMKAEMDTETLLKVLKDSAAYSKAMDTRGEIMINGAYDPPISRIKQHHKDVRLILEQGQKLASPTLLSQIHLQVLQAAEQSGLGESDTGSIIEIFRRLAGIPSK
ncbi:MAG: NAD(P)-dependent oxidoreductase [bacterium]